MSFKNCIVRGWSDARWYSLVGFLALAEVLAGRHAGAQPVPPIVAREFRAAWISPTEGGDWPSRPGLSVDEQKIEEYRAERDYEGLELYILSTLMGR